jgi:hypothetical protein
MKSGRRLFGKTLREDEVFSRFIRDLIMKYFPAAGDAPGKPDQAPSSPPKGGHERKGPKRP